MFALAAALLLAPQALSEPDYFSMPDHVLFDHLDGELWALGRSYKASLNASGFCYLPDLGPDAPKNRPLQVTLTAVRRGTEWIDLSTSEVKRVGDSLILDRGAVVERYRCSMTEVEQLIEVDLQSSSGEVRVDFRVETELQLPWQVEAPFVYGTNEAGVRIGEAYAVLNDGERVPVASIRTEYGYAIVVPEEVAASAGESLTIDPVISTLSVGTPTTRPDISSDVHAIGGLGFYVAIERQFSSTEHDICVVQVPSGSSGPGTFIPAIDISSTNYAEPAIAGTNIGSEFIVVATRDVGISRRIYARWSNGTGSSLGAPYVVSVPGLEAFDPDIGCETTGFDLTRRYVVVWTDIFPLVASNDVVYRILDRDGPVTDVELIAACAENELLPAISNGSGDSPLLFGGEFRVALARETVPGGDDYEILTAVIDRFGNLTVSPTVIGNATDVQGIAVSSSNGSRLANGDAPQLVAWDSLTSQRGDIFIAAVVEDTVVGFVRNLSAIADDQREFDQRFPAIAASEDQWYVAYQQRSFSPLVWQTVMCSGGLASDGFGLAERNVSAGTGIAIGRAPGIATLWEGGSSGPGSAEGLLTSTRRANPNQTDAAFLVPPATGSVAGISFCTANGNSSGPGAWTTAFGDNAVGSLHEIVCTDAPSGAACFMLVSRTVGFVPNVGGGNGNLCLGGSGFGRFSNQIAPVDATGRYSLTLDPSQISQPGGTVSAQVGETWYFQAWFRDVEGGVPVSNLSNGVAIRFDS
ncbi:MAG: hypothetical protein AAGG01_04535 [Planctomycetota bacterium]